MYIFPCVQSKTAIGPKSLHYLGTTLIHGGSQQVGLVPFEGSCYHMGGTGCVEKDITCCLQAQCPAHYKINIFIEIIIAK